MNIATTAEQLRHMLASSRSERIALVPTMGCLHEGHLSLIRKAKRLADIVVVSIYVNPLQFGANEDLDCYPRPWHDDVALCEKEGVDFIFHPHNLYPDDGSKVTLSVTALDAVLCGASRQGHFNGVATVVNILFNIVQPHLAIFGEKDWQQLAIIHRMTNDLHLPVEIIGSAIIREDDGLAMSSRNRYLSEQQRQQATHISAALRLMQELAAKNTSLELIHQQAMTYLNQHNIQPEYLDIRDENNLESIQHLEPHSGQHQARIFIAARLGETRLIDNMPLFLNLETTA